MGSSRREAEASKRKKRQRAPFERRIIRSSLWLAIPGFVTSGVLIWLQDWAIESKLALLAAELIVCGLILAALHDQIIRPLQTLANVVGALREEDYSFRARMAVPDDALGELSLEVNMLADLLAEHRVGAIEATALLQRVVEEVDIPLFAFDPGETLRLVNSAGESASSSDGAFASWPMFVRRIATVTISAPEATTAARVCAKSLYLPVPTRSRDR